jgi:hypothetical protein
MCRELYDFLKKSLTYKKKMFFPFFSTVVSERRGKGLEWVESGEGWKVLEHVGGGRGGGG